MALRFVDGDPFAVMVRAELGKLRINERGETFDGNSADLTALHIQVGPAGMSSAEEFLRRCPDGGVLVVSARTQLDARSPLRRMLSSGALSPDRLALAATRDWSPDARALVDGKGVQCYAMIEISREGLGEVTDAVMAYVRQWPAFMVVIDLDALDPAFAPGLSAPVPAGLSARELFYMAQRLRLIKTLAAVDIVADVEIADASTAALLARLIAELR